MEPVSQPVPCHGRCPHHYTSVDRNDNTNSSGDCPRPTREAGWAFTPGLWPVELRSEERVALNGRAVKRVGLSRRSTGLTTKPGARRRGSRFCSCLGEHQQGESIWPLA